MEKLDKEKMFLSFLKAQSITLVDYSRTRNLKDLISFKLFVDGALIYIIKLGVF